jgi:hypothetical protein
MRPRAFAVCFAIPCLLLAIAAPARAHHSFGVEYDANKPVTLTGVITDIEWTNPHSFVYIDVKDESGEVTNWKFEGYPPGVLYRTGWKRNSTIKTGDTITIFGWQAPFHLHAKAIAVEDPAFMRGKNASQKLGL